MKNQNGSNNTFTFSHVTMNDVLKELRSINIRKTTGCDLIGSARPEVRGTAESHGVAYPP